MLKNFIGGFFLGCCLFVVLGFALLVGGCSRSTAPAQDASGATPTGQTVTFKITGDVPKAFLSLKRSDVLTNHDISLPYESTFNVRGGERFELVSGVENAMNTKPKSNIKIEALLNGQPVASVIEGAEIPFMAHLVYTVPFP